MLIGGSPEEFPERYAHGSAIELVPLGVPQILLSGKYDTHWAPMIAGYYEKSKAAGDEVRHIEAPESGHFEMIDPDSTTWPLVLDAARDLLGLRP